ncbi:MAG TPA: signal peptidase II [Thermoanaerobaculia bacterium]|nr:signal peptidase II [Thermoanaerobaculia bacterium]
MKDLAYKSRFLFVALAVVVLDQWTKWLVEIHLPVHSAHPVLPGWFNLVHVRNTGVAFGLFASDTGAATGVLTLLALVALAAVVFYFWVTPARDRLLLSALSLVAGGAVGNLIDRVASGAVTDFLDVYYGTWHWPAFNVADSAISVGITLMVVETLLPGRLRHRPETDADARADAADKAAKPVSEAS